MMSTSRTESRPTHLVRLAGGLLVGGFFLNLVVTLFHPSGQEDDHPVIFARYAASDLWVAIHFGQFAGVLIALAGLMVLCLALDQRGGQAVLAKCAMGTAVATAAAWTVLQAVDGVTLKQAVDAWASAPGPDKGVRFANAETVRWAEWGIQSYFRLLLGLTLLLVGAGIARSRIVPRWLGWTGMLAGLLYIVIGIAVGHSGLEQPGDLVIQLLFLVFLIGVLVTGVRGQGSGAGGNEDERSAL